MVAFYGGCDIGSTTSKAVILGEGGEVVASALQERKIDPEESARLVLEEACSHLPALQRIEALSYLIGTGYGRNEVPFAQENISEITCHGVGAHFSEEGVRTLVDIGGQDVKAIVLHDDGTVREFAMNDKCAAGTGRFFEAMARIFQLDLGAFSRLSLEAKKSISVTSQCSVFAETEVISLLAKRKAPEAIAAGIQMAVAKRVFTLVRRVGLSGQLTVTGGCAKNPGLLAALEKVLRVQIVPLSFDPQLTGALGAAVLARRKAR